MKSPDRAASTTGASEGIGNRRQQADSSAREAFRAAIFEALGHAPEHPIPDGRIHRFATNDKRRDASGWYLLHADGVPAGAFGDWRSGLTQTWSARGATAMTPAEQKAMQAQIRAAQAQREAAQRHTHQQAADEALSRWKAALPAPADHPYLVAKGIRPHGARVESDKLLIAMHDAAGNIRSLQAIAPDGSKRFLPGGQVRGCFFMIARPSGVLIVCEGFATGATLHEASRHAVAVAFNCGNLEPVAKALRSRYPCLDLVIAADDDWRTEGNPGLSAARAAAIAVGGRLAVPDFSGLDRGPKDTDFNDVARLAGCIGSAI